jgi:hypothetical protein
MLKTLPYKEKIKICERKISNIDYQIAKELGELKILENLH